MDTLLFGFLKFYGDGFLIAGEDVLFVAIKIAPFVQLFSQIGPGSMEPDLYGGKRELQDISYFGVFETLKVVQYYDGLMVMGEALYIAPNAFTHLFADDLLLRGTLRLPGPEVPILNRDVILEWGMCRRLFE